MMRETVAEDRAFLIEVFKEEGILDGFPMKTPLEVEDSSGFWMEMALKGMGRTFEIDGKIAGMAVLYVPIYRKLSRASLFSIVVDRSYRRQNVATKLISALEQLGKEVYHLKIIHLEVYEKNTPAITLYQKLGFTRYGEQKAFIKENGEFYSKILMEKRLS